VGVRSFVIGDPLLKIAAGACALCLGVLYQSRLPDSSHHFAGADPHRIDSYQMITGEDDEAEREQWNRIFKTRSFVYGEQPTPFVKQSLPLLHRGKALVLAMEEGRDAVFLASHGFDVTGIDFSDEAIRKAKRLARKHAVQIHVVNANLNTYEIEPAAYDVIVVMRFYRKRLLAEIRKGLKPGGLIVWESHTSEFKQPSMHASAPDRLLGPGELGRAFHDYATVASRDVFDEEQQQVVSLVARKP
jgi:2-polyprenyl-3-methyl-5-hydroxy-6-metoxy-1,4-benzoquinol methylase